MLAEVLM
jgi:hypothetical protein